jgi:hypothetical protein
LPTPGGLSAAQDNVVVSRLSNGVMGRIVRTSQASSEIYVNGALAVTVTYNANGSVTHDWANFSLNGKESTAHVVTIPASRTGLMHVDVAVCPNRQSPQPNPAYNIALEADQSAQNAMTAAILADVGAGIASAVIDAATAGIAEVLGLSVAQTAAVANTISCAQNLKAAEDTLASTPKTICG